MLEVGTALIIILIRYHIRILISIFMFEAQSGTTLRFSMVSKWSNRTSHFFHFCTVQRLNFFFSAVQKNILMAYVTQIFKMTSYFLIKSRNPV